MCCTFTLRKTARFHKRRHSNSLSLPVTLSCVVALKSIMKQFIKCDECDFFYYSIIYKWHAQMSETQIPESLFSLWSFIFEDTSIRATKLLHKSKLNPVVFCERPERSDQKHTQNQRSLEAKQEYEFQKWFYIVTFLYKHHLHKDSHSEVFEVPQSPSLHTYINRQWWFGFTYNIRKYIKCYKTCCSF